ncbi:FUSC family protein [Streptomyces sp. NPDC001599]|uniref:FUSC family protein n=1 Tax=Streptomyces sp. NPDC001599 TaxID=3364591 RepID=UPI00368817C7
MSGAATRTAHRWRAARPRFDRGRAARSLLAFGFSLGTVTAVGGIHYGIFAAMGCYVDAYGARDPYPRRGPLLVILSAAFLVAFAAGSAAAGEVWAMVGVLSVVSVAATLVVRTLRLSGPGSYFVVLVAAMAAFLPPAPPSETAVRAGCLALGAAVSWLAGMSGRLSRPYGPEEREVSAAFRSVAAFAEARTGARGGPKAGTEPEAAPWTETETETGTGTGTGTAPGTETGAAPGAGAEAEAGAAPGTRAETAPGAGAGAETAAGAGAAPGAGVPGPRGVGSGAGRDAYAAVHRAWAALNDAREGHGEVSAPEPAPRRMTLYALMTGLETLLDTVQNAAERDGEPVSPARIAWLRAAGGRIAAGGVPGPCPGGPATARDLLATAHRLWPVPLPPRKSLLAELRRLLSRSSPGLPVALRVGLAVAVGTVLGAVLPLLHPAWVAVGAAAALQGGPGQQPARRARARFVGTVSGVALTALVFHSCQPGTWVTVAVATVAHALSRGLPPDALLTRTLLNTPVALLLVAAAVPAGLGRLAAFRLLDLTLGLVLGVAAALLLGGVPRRRVCAAVANAVAGTGAAVQERLRTGAVRVACEGTAWQRMTELWDMHAAVPTEEIRTSGTADRLWPTVLAVRRLLSWSVLGRLPAPDPDAAVLVGRHVEALTGAAHAGLPGSLALRRSLSGPPRAPESAHHPELHRRLADLTSALAGPDAGLEP